MKKLLVAFSFFILLAGASCTDFINSNLTVDKVDNKDKDTTEDKDIDSNKSDKTTKTDKSTKTDKTTKKTDSKYEKYADFDAAEDPLIDAEGMDFDSWELQVDGEDIGRDYQVKVGSQLKLIFDGVTGYEVIDGMVFPGAYMTVSDLDGNELMKEDDLFAQYTETGASEEDGKYISVYLTIGNPMEVGETYDWYVYVWDKESEGFIDGFITFDVVA